MRRMTALFLAAALATGGLAACSKSECEPISAEGPTARAALESGSTAEALPALQRLRDGLASSEDPTFRILHTRAEQVIGAIERAAAPADSLEQRDYNVTNLTNLVGTFNTALDGAEAACQ